MLHVVLLQPVNDKAIGRQQPQDAAVVNGLQWSNPGVKLLLRELCLQGAKALVPER